MDDFFSGPAWSGPQLHVYAVPGAPVQNHLAEVQAHIGDAAPWGMAWSPPQWAHATVQRLNAVPEELDSGALQDLTARLRRAYATLAPMVLTMGLPTVGRRAVECWCTSTSWEALCAATRAAIADACPEILPPPGPEQHPHVTLAYGTGPEEADDDTLQHTLDTTTPASAPPVEISALDLVSVHRGSALGYFWWDTIEQIPLGDSAGRTEHETDLRAHT
ncbi:2'-5' RNA ligase family protein [Salinifilum ghardaiensis]